MKCFNNKLNKEEVNVVIKLLTLKAFLYLQIEPSYKPWKIIRQQVIIKFPSKMLNN